MNNIRDFDLVLAANRDGAAAGSPDRSGGL